MENKFQYQVIANPTSTINQNYPIALESDHPWQWADRAQNVQLASSPDRIDSSGFTSRPNSPLSSPCRSSPILFSPPPQGALLKKHLSRFQDDSLRLNNSIMTPSSILSHTIASANSSSKRGRPSQELISELIISGSSSNSQLKCLVCQRVFPRHKSLQAHMRIHTGERPYKCSFKDCNRAFAQSGQLRTHQRLHTGEKPFICRAIGCEHRFTHSNRKCSIHPSSGLKRISFDLTHTQSISTTKPVATKKSSENKKRVKNLNMNHTSHNNNNDNNNNKSISKPVLGNITSSVINSPSKKVNSCATTSTCNINRPMPVIVARKSVIVNRTSRKLELELNAVATPSLCLTPTNNNVTKIITPPTCAINNENKLSQEDAQRESERNRMDILGALALMELANGTSYRNSTEIACRSPKKRFLNSENIVSDDAYIYSSPKKLRAILSSKN